MNLSMTNSMESSIIFTSRRETESSTHLQSLGSTPDSPEKSTSGFFAPLKKRGRKCTRPNKIKQVLENLPCGFQFLGPPN